VLRINDTQHRNDPERLITDVADASLCQVVGHQSGISRGSYTKARPFRLRDNGSHHRLGESSHLNLDVLALYSNGICRNRLVGRRSAHCPGRHVELAAVTGAGHRGLLELTL